MILMGNNTMRVIGGADQEKPQETKGDLTMAYVLSDNARTTLAFLQSNPQVELTKKELAEQTGIPSRSMVGVVNGLKKRGLVDDPEKEFEGEGAVKVVVLTPDGAAFDPDTEKPAKAE